MRVIVGCPVKDRAWCLPDWFEAVEAQGVDVEYLFIYTPGSDETEEVLLQHTTNILIEPTGRSETEIAGHLWGDINKYAYMAHMRNELLRNAHAMGADYFFSLDSDIILPPDGLKRLLSYASTHPGVVAPKVNMSWGATNWNVMSWVDPKYPRMAERSLVPPKTGQHHVVMAAMLLDRDAIDRGLWVAHHQGEDIGFSVHAWKEQIPLWWVEEIHCQHWMRRH